MDEFSDGTKIFAPKDNPGTIKREWVGLTDEEFEEVIKELGKDPRILAVEIEIRLMEKNT
jgi:hypothetical protein